MLEVLKKIYQILIDFFKQKPVWNEDMYVEAFNYCIKQYENIRETEGKNRSKAIDLINNTAQVELGSPYCVSGYVYGVYPDIVKYVKDKYNIILKYTGVKTAGSQKFFSKMKEMGLEIPEPKPGCAAIYKNIEDGGHGHFTGVTSKFLDDKKSFNTFEFNTSTTKEKDGEMQRDGEGAAYKVRSISGYKGKTFNGFIDVYKAFTEVKSNG